MSRGSFQISLKGEVWRWCPLLYPVTQFLITAVLKELQQICLVLLKTPASEGKHERVIAQSHAETHLTSLRKSTIKPRREVSTCTNLLTEALQRNVLQPALCLLWRAESSQRVKFSLQVNLGVLQCVLISRFPTALTANVFCTLGL